MNVLHLMAECFEIRAVHGPIFRGPARPGQTRFRPGPARPEKTFTFSGPKRPEKIKNKSNIFIDESYMKKS